MGGRAKPAVTRSDLYPLGSAATEAIDWARESESLSVLVDQKLLFAATHGALPSVIGELAWIYRKEQAQCITLYVHPVLLIHEASDLLQVNHVEIVPRLHPSDPLLHHMTLALQTAMEAEGSPSRLYAEVLINALAVHLLRRYATCGPAIRTCPSGLLKTKLQRITEYIEVHLAQDLSVTELAAVAQMSPTYFARQFRQATGQTPHQYVIGCRIERAKRLLRDTEWPIIEIGHQVGFTDQSYFTAVFHKHVSMTPKAYRDDTQW
jgi:AraC family transcriptional regulator